MTQTLKVNSIVLVGGQSQRFGRDKLIERINGLKLIEHVIERLKGISSRILLVGSGNMAELSVAGGTCFETVRDVYPDKGTLGGLYTGLLASDTEYNIAVAGDMPFLNRGLLRYMDSLAPGFDAVVPRVGEYLEPLCAVYARSSLAPIEEALRQGRLSIVGLLPSLQVRYVTEEEIGRYDPGHLSFMNINTQADLERAKLLAVRCSPAHGQKRPDAEGAAPSPFSYSGGET